MSNLFRWQNPERAPGSEFAMTPPHHFPRQGTQTGVCLIEGCEPVCFSSEWRCAASAHHTRHCKDPFCALSRTAQGHDSFPLHLPCCVACQGQRWERHPMTWLSCQAIEAGTCPLRGWGMAGQAAPGWAGPNRTDDALACTASSRTKRSTSPAAICSAQHGAYCQYAFTMTFSVTCTVVVESTLYHRSVIQPRSIGSCSTAKS